MANTPTTDLQFLTPTSDAESATGWSDSLFSAYDNGNAANFGLDNLLYIQDANALSQQLATNRTGASSLINYAGTDPAGFTDGTSVFYFWWNFLYPGATPEYNDNTAVTAPGQNNVGGAAGYAIGIGSSGTAAKFFHVGGANFGRSPEGGWQNVAIDPSRTTFAGWTLGTPTAGVYNSFGFLPIVNTAPGRGQANAVDAIRWGRGEIEFTGGAPAGTFADMATQNDLTTNRWGIFGAQKGGFVFKGKLTLGTSATSLLFEDTDVTIVVDETRQVYDAFNLIEVNNASSNITWTNIVISKVASAGLSLDGAKGNFTMVDNATVAKTGCSFTDMGIFIYQSNATLSDVTWRRCNQVTQGGATINDGSTFENLTASAYLISTPSTINLVTNSKFETDSATGNAVDVGTVTSSATITWDGNELVSPSNRWTGVAANGISTTANGAIKITATGGNAIVVDISVVNGATTPSVETDVTGLTGGGSLTVNVILTVTVTISGLLGNTEVSVLQNPSPYSSAVAAPTTLFDEDVLSAVTGTDIELDTGGGANITQILRTGTTDFTTMNLVGGDQVRVSQRSNLKIFDTYTVVGTPTASAITVTPVASSTSALPAIIDSPGETVTVEKVNASYTFSVSAGEVVDILAFRVGSLPVYQLNQTISATNNSFPLSQVVDRNFDAFEV